MKRFILSLLLLIAGVAIGIAYSNLSGTSPSVQSPETADSHTGHDHPPGEGHEQSTATDAEDALDWCVEHRVPESVCTQCNPSLIASFKAKNDWCAGHAIPESHCRLCNPGIEFPQEAAIRASQPKLDLGVSVFFPDNQALCATDGAIVQFASPETFSRAGLSVEPVIQASELAAIEAPAEVVFDQQAEAIVTLPVRASVIHWMLDPGEVVREGQMLALCEAPEAARLKGEYLEAQAISDRDAKTLERQKELFARNLVDAASVEQAHADATASEAHRKRTESELRALGLSDADLEEVRGGKLTARFALRAPSAGTLVKRDAQIGLALEEGTALATIADPSSLWIEAKVRGSDLARIRQGQTAVFTADGSNLDRVTGRVIWISQYLDPDTRTGVVRVAPIEHTSHLRANQFGHLDFMDDASHASVLVPRDAVQWEGCCHVVFVREAQDRYRPRKVAIAKGDNAHYRVLSGLSPDDWVVVNGSFLLKTELKKSSIGAGCCGLEAKS